jgi:hypothetical protein
MRGLAEKIWKVFAPSRWAVSAASSSDFERDVWIPIRRNGYRSSTVLTAAAVRDIRAKCEAFRIVRLGRIYIAWRENDVYGVGV